MEAARKAVARPWQHKIGIGLERFRLLTDIIPRQGCLCGELAVFEDGKEVSLIDTQQDGSTWKGSAPPKDKEGNPRKHQEASLFFAIKENHVAIIQSKELSARELLDFLTKFIQHDASLVAGSAMLLMNIPAQSALEKLKDHGIKSVSVADAVFRKVKTEIVPDTDPSGAKVEGKRKKWKQTIETGGLASRLLAALDVEQAVLDDMVACGDPGSITVEVEIKYRSRSEKEARKVLNGIAATFGSNDELDTTIKLDGKTEIKQGELTIKDDLKIQAPGGNLSSDDAFSRLAEWLINSIKSGKIL